MKKVTVRLAVLAALLAWPTLLSYQVWQAEQQLEAATQLEQKVNVRLADARAKAASTQVAHKEAQ